MGLMSLENLSIRMILTLCFSHISAAASVEQARPVIVYLPLDVLLESYDYKHSQWSSFGSAKLGLADKALSANEGEVMGLL